MAFNYSPRIITDGLVLYLDAANTRSYPGTGTTWSDLSRGGNNGTLVNGPTFNSGNGGSIVFDGSNDYVTLGSLSLLTSNTFTLELWIKFNVLTNGVYYTMFSYGGYVSGGWLLQREGATISSNKLRFAFNGTGFWDTSTSFTSTGTWKNIVLLVLNGIPQLIYVNGISDTLTLTGTGTLSISNPKQIDIGRRTDINSQYSNANISKVSIYNRALSSTEILQNYNATKTRFGL